MMLTPEYVAAVAGAGLMGDGRPKRRGPKGKRHVILFQWEYLGDYLFDMRRLNPRWNAAPPHRAQRDNRDSHMGWGAEARGRGLRGLA
jgi:hypothetical protein